MPPSITHIPALLRGSNTARLRHLLLWVVVFGGFYGLVMGSFGGFGGARRVQPIFSAVKVPMLLGVSFLLTFPFFFVISTLTGLRNDFLKAVKATVAAQAAMAFSLASLSPFTALCYVSTTDYAIAVLFNGGVFSVAITIAAIVLRRSYRDLIQQNPKHRLMLAAWLTAYTFIAIQMAWVLRPFVGAPGDLTFFRPGAWGNAYLVITDMIIRNL